MIKIRILGSESESADTNNEKENIMNKRRGQKRMTLLSSSEEESEKISTYFSL